MIFKDFSSFLKEGNFLPIALAFVMGAASDSFIKSFVNNVFMAFVDPLTGIVPWQEAVLSFGPFSIKYGAFLADTLHFVILAFLVFLIAKKVFKLQKIGQ